MKFDANDIRSYLIQSLNMALDIEGETTYTNSFDIQIFKNGFSFIPRAPCSYLLDNNLYQRIFAIANGVLYPMFTLLKQNGAYFRKRATSDIHIARELYFPWFQGVPERIVIDNLSDFLKKHTENQVPIMQNFNIDFNDINHVLIAGNSGSGKTTATLYLMTILKNIQGTKLIVVDPKLDKPTRWGNQNHVKVIFPQQDRSTSDFVSQVSDMLSVVLGTIHHRQELVQQNPEVSFPHLVVMIDEVLALSISVAKSIRDAFFGLLTQIALLGRATKVHLILASQRFDAQAVPVVVREQANLLIQLGNINQKTTQFLFPSLGTEGMVIPIGRGTGIIQIIDGVHAPNVMPLLMPTIRSVNEDENRKKKN